MTPAQQRDAIAKACGGTFINGGPAALVWDPDIDSERVTHYYWKWSDGTLSFDCPSYPTDLNAMHDAEIYQQSKDPVWWKAYSAALYRAYGVSATAAQRADTFLLTLNITTNQ